MIAHGQSITAKNVISLNCVVDMEMMNAAFTDFIDNVIEAGYTPVGNVFFANGGELMQTEAIPMQLFVSVEEDHHGGLTEEFNYRTYFQVRRVLQTRVKGMSQLDFARGMEALGEAVTKLDGEYPNTPTFFVFTEFEGEIYTDIGVGLQFEKRLREAF